MKIIFNPFEKYTENRLLTVGLFGTLLGSALAYFLFARFDGMLDLHFVPEIEWWQPFVDNVVNILSIAFVLFIAGKIVNNRTRFVDILAASIVARLPYYLLPLFNINSFVYKASSALVDPETLQIRDFSPGILVPLLIFAFFSLIVLGWYLIMLYNGYKTASHAKGVKPVLFFIGSIILAEVASKYLILQLI